MNDATLIPTTDESDAEPCRELTEREATQALERALSSVLRSRPAPTGWLDRRSASSPLTTRFVRR